MRARTWLPAIALSLAALLAPAPARAQEGTHDVEPTPATPEESAFMDPEVKKRPWREGTTRTFAATTIDVGFVYLRPRLSLGYGKPHSSWVGVDVNPLGSINYLGGYGGARVVFSLFEFRVGAKYIFSILHKDLLQQDSYSRLDLESTVGPRATYTALEAELKLALPVGPGEILGFGGVTSLSGVPAGFNVFEETLNVIVAPPLVWRGRGGYEVRVGGHAQHGISLVGEVLHVPARHATTTRGGVVMHFGFSRSLELRGSFIVPFTSPDTIGLVGGDFTELGLRYRWATGE